MIMCYSRTIHIQNIVLPPTSISYFRTKPSLPSSPIRNTARLAGTVKLRQHQRITAIRFHPIARFDRDQRQRHHNAIMAQTGQQPVQPITAQTGFIAEAQASPPSTQPRHQLRENLRTVLETPDLADLTAAAAFGNGDRDRRLMHIQSDVGDSIHQARLPCMTLCGGRSGITLDICMLRGGPPDHSANIGSSRPREKGALCARVF